MSRKASEFQYKVMSLAYRGKEVFKPLNTGWVDEHVACVREYVANVFFYRKGETTIMIDAGYNYDRLGEKMRWLGLDAGDVHDILITHQDTDHVGAIERDAPGLFRTATLYVGREEHRYLTGEVRRRVYWGTYRLPQVHTDNPVVLLDDRQVLHLGGVKVEALHVPGHTWGHMVYLVDDAYLFTGDTLWLGPDGGKAFLDTLAEDGELSIRSLRRLEGLLRERGLRPKILTGHTGWTDDVDFAFAHTSKICHALFRQRPHDPSAPFDAYVETDDTQERAQGGYLAQARRVPVGHDVRFWDRSAFAYDLAMRSGDEGLSQAAAFVASFADGHDVCLDAACGTGAFACALAGHAGFVGACDLSPNMVARARRKARHLGITNVAFGIADICSMDFADDTFDLVVAGNVLHLLEDPERALGELGRVTRPGGLVALPTYVNGEARDRRFLGLIHAAGFVAVHEWDETSYLAFLEHAGMRVVEHRMFSAKQPLCVAICAVATVG